jgi:hypothetical protein
MASTLCLQSGKWEPHIGKGNDTIATKVLCVSNTPPVCQSFQTNAWLGDRVSIGKQSNLINAAAVVDLTNPLLGDQVSFLCDDTNISPTFSSTICLQTGQWDPPLDASANRVECGIACPTFDATWMDIGVAKNPSGATSITSPTRVVDWAAALFGDQLAFKCDDPFATVSGPSSPTCAASGMWLPTINVDNKVVCNCPIGKFMGDAGLCTECPPNTYSAKPGAKVCAACDASLGETAAAGSAMCTRAALDCPDGTYQDVAKSSCISCLKNGAICESNEITLLNGWWFDSEAVARSGKEVTSETEVFMCLNENSCVVDVVNVTVSCSAGYMGVLCGACNLKGEGYMRSGQICRKCDSFATNVIFVTAMAVIAVAYILYVIAFQDFASTENDQRGVVIKIAMSFCQMLAVLGVFKARGTVLFNELVQRPASIAGGGISSVLQLKCLMNSQIYGTFMLSMMTPIIACTLTAILIGPVWFIKRVQEMLRASYPPRRAPIEKVNVLRCCRKERMEDWEKKLWLHARTRNDREAFRPIARFVAVLVFVLFGIYPTLVKSIFSIFRCSEPIGGKMYLTDDFTVQCWVGWHPTFAGAAIAFGCLYLFGIPLGLLLILKFNRHRLQESRFVATFGAFSL